MVLQHAVLDIPAVENSDLPGLMGLSALKKNRAILDFNSSCLYFCGEGQYDLKAALPAKTDKYQLETAPSGHLVLPCCEYETGTTSSDHTLTLVANGSESSTGMKASSSRVVPPPPKAPPRLPSTFSSVPTTPPPGLDAH